MCMFVLCSSYMFFFFKWYCGCILDDNANNNVEDKKIGISFVWYDVQYDSARWIGVGYRAERGGV